MMKDVVRTHSDYTVGWVCALPKEQTAATVMLDGRHPDLPIDSNDTNVYTLGSIGHHNVVIACLPDGKLGTSSAANVATQLIRSFPGIRFGLMVGIGGGMPSKVKLGDVVVSVPRNTHPGVVQWDFGKAEPGNNFRRTGALNNPPTILLTALGKLATTHEIQGSQAQDFVSELKTKHPRLSLKYQKPSSELDVLCSTCNRGNHTYQDYAHAEPPAKKRRLAMKVSQLANDASQVLKDAQLLDPDSISSCDGNALQKREPGEMQIHRGLIASGNCVVKDAAFRDQVDRRLGGDVLCFEMESAGLMDNFPCVVIRGICDYADSHKTKEWQEYAAVIAAAFAKELLGCVLPTQVGLEPTALELLDKLSKSVASMEQLTQRNAAYLNRKENVKILDWLSQHNYGSQHSDILKKLHPGTGTWLFESAVFKRWLSSPKLQDSFSASRQTLYCSGIPGAGKTVLTSGVVQHIETRCASDNTVGIAYLYCDYTRRAEQTIDHFLASISRQLLQNQSSPLKNLRYLHDQHLLAKTRPTRDELSNLLQYSVALYSKVFVMVDALDECETANECRTELVREILQLQTSYNIKLFTTSRINSDIASLFSNTLHTQVFAHRKDLSKFLRSRVEKHQGRHFDDTLLSSLESKIIDAAEGMFLLAKLQVDIVLDLPTMGDVKRALEGLRKGVEGLNATYTQAMERIENHNPPTRHLAKRILQWIVHSERRLSLLELQHALAIQPQSDFFDRDFIPTIKTMESCCAGLISVDKDRKIVRLVHYTTQEYFETTSSKWFPQAQRDMTIDCVTYLSYADFGSGFCTNAEAFNARLYSYPFYDYAACNWGHHGRAARVCEEVIPFLEKTAQMAASGQLFLTKYGKDHAFLEEPAQMAESGQLFLTKHGKDHDIFGPKENVACWTSPLHISACMGLFDVLEVLIKRYELDHRDSKGRSVLSYAVEFGHECSSKLLLAHGANARSREVSGSSVLHYAVLGENTVIVEQLLANGANPHWHNLSGRTPFTFALRRGLGKIVDLFLTYTAKLCLRDIRPYDRALVCAVRNKHEEATILLLSYSDTWDWLRAIIEGGKTAVLSMLLADEGIDPSLPVDTGKSPLRIAVEYGQDSIVKLLLTDKRVSPNTDIFTENPLLSSAVSSFSKAVLNQRLLESQWKLDPGSASTVLPQSLLQTKHKVDPGSAKTIIDRLLNGGTMVLSHAQTISKLLLQVDPSNAKTITKLLLDDGKVDPSFAGTILELLLDNRMVDPIAAQSTIKLLLDDRRVDPNAEDSFGITPLCAAISNTCGNANIVQLLLADERTDPNLALTGLVKYNPLCLAIERQDANIVKLLLADRRLDPNILDSDGRSPLSLASCKGDESILKLLLADKRVKPSIRDIFRHHDICWAIEHEDFVRAFLADERVSPTPGERDEFNLDAFL
ncbi:ankyrin repeat protein [Xylariaceae sp. FL0255]|nr:ankyrin repeat protein [Xylariaceae sp. FL0255]